MPVFDGLWCNPGPPSPHCAALHAGYKLLCVRSLSRDPGPPFPYFAALHAGYKGTPHE
jgi:hypothetical protein